MNLTQTVIAEIKKSQGATLPYIIKDLIKSNSVDKLRMQTLWSEYLGNVPIKSEYNSDNPARPAEKLAHDFRGTIVQQETSYLVGNTPGITLSEDGATDIEKAQDMLDNFMKINHFDKLIGEICTYSSVCGKSFILLYYTDMVNYLGEKTVEVMAKNIKPFEAIIINDGTTDEPQLGMIYYEIEVNEGINKYHRTKVELYDNTNVYYFIEDGNKNFVPDTTYGDAVQQHGFTTIPLVKFSNNTLEMGSFEKVRTLIDAYDSVVSGAVSDFKAYAMAYLIFYGVQPDENQLLLARKTGAFYIPKDNDADANNDIKFLTKDPNVQNLKELADRLNNDIFRFSSAVDYSDESFGGNQSGEARKYKLIPMESKASEKEKLLKYGFEQLFKAVSSFWSQLTGVKIDYTEMEYTFTRNLPLDVSINDIIALQQAQIISTSTAIENLPFISDSEAEYEKVEEEKSTTGAMLNLDNLSMNETTGSAA